MQENTRAELGNPTDSANFFYSFSFPTDAEILDIGSNIGSFLTTIHAAGWENVYGIDIVEKAITSAKSRHPELADRFSHYDGQVIPFQDNRFDVATFFNVIEHIPPDQMESFIKEILRVLKPGGTLVIMTPFKYIDMIYETIRYKDFGWRRWHCSLQTVSSMRKLLTNCGFESVDYYKINLKTDYYRGRARQHLGPVGELAVQVLSRLPLALFPTISAAARKDR